MYGFYAHYFGKINEKDQNIVSRIRWIKTYEDGKLLFDFRTFFGRKVLNVSYCEEITVWKEFTRYIYFPIAKELTFETEKIIMIVSTNYTLLRPETKPVVHKHERGKADKGDRI